MSYSSAIPELTEAMYKAYSCPYLIMGIHCAGGDYCPFLYGKMKLCCFYCPRFHDCPDRTGVCERLKIGGKGE